jgi:hypothetical protein
MSGWVELIVIIGALVVFVASATSGTTAFDRSISPPA